MNESLLCENVVGEAASASSEYKLLMKKKEKIVENSIKIKLKRSQVHMSFFHWCKSLKTDYQRIYTSDYGIPSV